VGYFVRQRAPDTKKIRPMWGWGLAVQIYLFDSKFSSGRASKSRLLPKEAKIRVEWGMGRAKK